MGPCTANAQQPAVDSRCRGTTISCCVADLRHCLPATVVTGVQQLTRYCEALPCRQSVHDDTKLIHYSMQYVTIQHCFVVIVFYGVQCYWAGLQVENCSCCFLWHINL